jgi:hypothetical protein
MALVTVQMEDYELLEMLLDRLSYWGRDDERDLYEQMYQNMLDNGCFEYGEFNVMSIVDNDVVNYCNVITKEDCPQDFEKLLELHRNGEYDVSCESFEDISPSFIEAVSDDETRILIR